MTVDEVKAQYSMRDVVEMCGLSINRSGFCVCPFHTEKTASLKVYEDSFYCFGCGAHGDIFAFIMKLNDCDFKTAFTMLGGSHSMTDAGYARIARRRREKQKKQEQLDKARFDFDEALKWESTWSRITEMAEPLTDEWCNAVKHREMWSFKTDIALETLLDVMEQNK